MGWPRRMGCEMTHDEKIEQLLKYLYKTIQEEVQEWQDIASGLKTYEEVKGSLRPEIRSRTLELVRQWERERSK
jgi:signal transduction histidine kinase